MKPKNKQNNYKNQNGCHNCDNCFMKAEYDEECTYYCNSDKAPRPLCGSVYMHEYKQKKTNVGIDVKFDYQKWEDWHSGREVLAWGICDKWKKSKIKHIYD